VNTTPVLGADVERFVAAVRLHFTDLDPEEREELLGGLEADISDLVAERGPGALGDPDAYATELRAAAGLPPAAAPHRRPGPLGIRVEAWLDGARARWDAVATGLPGDPWELVRSLRPVWWVARAWVALQAVDLLFGSGSYNLGLSPVPSLLGWGLPLLVVAIIGSVQMGRGRCWPARPGRGVAARVLLLVLNTCALALVPVTMTSVLTPAKVAAWGMDDLPAAEPSDRPAVITYQGRQVCALRVVDKDGRRVEGLRVLDATSRVLLPMNNRRC
jgi:hypothetical protein